MEWSEVVGKSGPIQIVLTWRLAFYLSFLGFTLYLVGRAVWGYYENAIFAGFVTLCYLASQILSVFLIQRTEE